MSRESINIFAVWSVVCFLLGLGFGGCSSRAHAAELPTCESYVQQQVESHSKADAKVGTASRAAPDHSPIILFRVVNPTAGEVFVWAFTMTDVGAAAVQEAGMKRGPQCSQEGKVWTSFTINLSQSI